MNLDNGSKIQFLNSLHNQQRELQNVQAKMVNLRLLEKNLVKSIKKKQSLFKLSLKRKKVSTLKTEQFLFLSETSCLSALLDLSGFPAVLNEPILLDLASIE